MRSLYYTNALQVHVCLQIIVLFIFNFTTIFAHPHLSDKLIANPHTHPQKENDLMYDLNEFNDLYYQSSNPSKNTYPIQNEENNNLNLIDNNFYLLDDDFDFGSDEFELQKLEINEDDLEIAKEYENFLNSFYKETTFIGSKTISSNTQSDVNFVHLNNKVKYLESEKQILNQKIEHLEKKLQSADAENTRVNELEYEKRHLNQKIENLEKKLQSTISDNLYDDLKKRLEKLNEAPEHNENIVNSSSKSRYRVSAIIGATIPIGSLFGVGPNVGIRLDTPVAFNLAGMAAAVGTEIYFSSMSPTKESSGDRDFINNSYFLANIVGNISIVPFHQMNNKHLSAMEIISGLGLTSASISQNQTTTISIHTNINYYLPMDLSGFKIGLNLLTQLTFGHPTSDNTTSFINAGLVIKTPLRF